MENDCFPPACEQDLIDKLLFPFINQGLSLTKEMEMTVRRVNKKAKKAKKQPLLHAELINEASEVKAPTIKLLAMTNKPGPDGTQSLSHFETTEDLLEPGNFFCTPEMVIKLVGSDLQTIQLLNAASKLTQAAQRKLTKSFNEL
ncbi:hypothetical protein A9179_13065 [Pseudomonas alcaligenes]|uniref:Uncharacterized protein n=1 Tax=Aquipseudomonas alcaligenes TaxID=43263 RepID=A0ABR7S2C4_AQUAC|nr:hypothetical protein [Pseudomonas alcaligenes]MBC9251209.1 hypothetical protein [Pseudomonas alcaligenes]